MKKSVLAAFAAVAMLTSCGGGSANLENPESAAKAAISQAEDSIKIGESSFIGTLPSICKQYMVANADLGKMYSDEIKEMYKNMENQDDLVKARSKDARLSDVRKEAKEIISKKYNEMKEKAASGLDGKEVPCKFDPEQYSNVKVTVKEVQPNSGISAYVVFDVAVTPSASLGKYSSYVNWQYRDAEGKTLKDGSKVLTSNCAVGQTANFEFGADAIVLDGVTELYFGKAEF